MRCFLEEMDKRRLIISFLVFNLNIHKQILKTVLSTLP